MFKLTRLGGCTYAQLAQSFRDKHGGQVDALLSALLRAKGRSADISTPCNP